MNQTIRSPQVSSLYIGDLHPEVTENELFSFFKQPNLNPVTVKICRDHFTNRSLCYGYANFNSSEEAERAMEALNSETLHGRTCRIMWSQRDPSLRRSGIGNIFVGNLSPSTNVKDLFDLFSQFGNILSCKVVMDENGVSKGYGFVHFESVESSDNAVASANNSVIHDMRITVLKHISYRERQAMKNNTWTNVYVKNLHQSFTEERLRELFQEYGSITSIFLKDTTKPSFIDSNDTYQPLKFGFVNFSRHEEALKAVENLNKKLVDNLTLYVARAQTRSERDNELKRLYQQSRIENKKIFQNVNLYVKNLDDNITEDDLKRHFSAFGKIHSVYIKRDSNGIPAGFGYVCFTTQEDADAAIKGLHNQLLPGGTKPLYVAHHQTKEFRYNLRNSHLQYNFPYNAYPFPYPSLAPGQIPLNVTGYAAPQNYNRAFPQPYVQRLVKSRMPPGSKGAMLMPLPFHSAASQGAPPFQNNNQIESITYYLENITKEKGIISTILNEIIAAGEVQKYLANPNLLETKLSEKLQEKNNTHH